MTKFINDKWELYKSKVIPPHSTEAQIGCMKHAFYAGAISTFVGTVLKIEAEGYEKTAGAEDGFFNVINDEIHEYITKKLPEDICELN